MAGLLPASEKARLLNELTSGTLYLGLAESVTNLTNPSLVNVNEISTDGYTRELVDWNDAVVSDTGVVRITNDGDVEFGPFVVDMTSDARYAFLATVATGTAGSLRYVWELADPIRARAQKTVRVPDAALSIE